MGLLSYINTMEQKGPGLLARASQYEASDAHAEDFYQWCKRHGFSHIAILQHDGNYYHITKSLGFDAESIALSYSSKDFWEGTLLTDTDWQTFVQGTNQLGSFNQFFSEQMLSMITKLHFIKLDDSVLMLMQEDEDFSLPPANDIRKELLHLLYMPSGISPELGIEDAVQEGLAISNASIYFLSVKNAVATAIKDVPFADDSAKQKMTDIIYEHIAQICGSLFQKPNCSVLGKNGEIKIAFFSKDEIDEQLLQFHIVQTLSDIVGKEAAGGILLLMAGVCPHVKGILAFLQQG